MNNIEFDISTPKYATESKRLDARVSSRVLRDLDTVYPHFEQLWRRARRNVRYVANDQWDEVEKAALRRQRRYPFVWNKIKPIVDSLCGTQVQTRMDVHVLPVEMGDEKDAALLNRLVKWAEQINNLPDIEAQVFENGVIQGLGVTQVRWVFEDFESGYPKIERLPMNQFVWDLNATQMSLEDARWQARIIPMMRLDAIELLPQYKNIINESPLVGERYGIWENLTKAQRDMNTTQHRDFDRNLIFLTEHYEKKRVVKYLVVDTLNDSQDVFEAKLDAEAFLEGLLAVHTNNGDPLTDTEGNETVFMQPLQQDVFVQTILVGNDAVQQVTTDLPCFPYQPFFSNFIDGECWAYVDGMISPQKFLNRMISEQDNLIARGNKQLMTVIEGLLPKGWDAARVQRERGVPGKVIPIQRDGAINAIDHKPIPFEYGQLAASTAQHILEMGGGANIMGLQENAAESGKTVKARQAAAGLSRVKLFANLRSWRKQVTEMMLWQMKEYLNDRQIIRVVGTDQDVNYYKLKKDDLDRIKDMRTDISIEPTVESDIAREETYNQILQFLQTGAGAALDPMTQTMLLLESNPSMPREIKNKIISMSQQFQAFQQWQSEQSKIQKNVQSVEQTLEKSGIKGMMEGAIAQYVGTMNTVAEPQEEPV